MILIDELSKTYRRAGGKGEVQALADITVSIKDGEFVRRGRAERLRKIDAALYGRRLCGDDGRGQHPG